MMYDQFNLKVITERIRATVGRKGNDGTTGSVLEGTRGGGACAC